MATRRQFLKSMGAMGAVGMIGGCAVQCGGESRHPNIVLILSDDQGWNDVSLYGGEIPTPHIDSIGLNGIQFTRFYVAAPVCTPSRYGLLTGRYPCRAPQPFWSPLMPGQDDEIKLPEGEKTMADELQERGYATALIGKWHLGHGDPEFGPNEHGFDYFYGFLPGCIDFYTHSYRSDPALYRNKELMDAEGWATDLFTDAAIQFIEAHREKPFFLYLAYNAPHYGKCTAGNLLQSPPGYADLQATAKDDRNVYAAMVKNMDENIGRLLGKLRDWQLTNNTLVIFLSDNGGSYAYGGNNMPLLGEKGTLWEGGIRVPCVMQWPARIEPDQVLDQPCCAIDVLPTLLALIGGPGPSRVIDGVDLSDVILYNASAPSRHLYFLYKRQKAIINGDWKYVRDVTDKEYLFNLAEDPGEQKNVAAPLPQATIRLRDELDSFAARMLQEAEEG